MEDQEKITVLCVGPKGSGKTTLLKRLQEEDGIDYTYSPVPTIGTNLYDIHYLNKNGKKQILTIREVGGEMVQLWYSYLDGIEKVIFVVDTSNLCQISSAAVMLYTLLAEPKLRQAKMRNEALLMLQFTRLCSEQANTLILLEASPLTGVGLDSLRQFLIEKRKSSCVKK
ncbi:unnamed protein product [Leptidea sinapis]|uniref:ADP-ribosylation factor-like protein 16 n=1 Tax=Leptidea sinapis TaxID=189913 RepID=A0A5E4PNW4_9NEOP|nr:unnamed protein product [Leptidea sinapis]